MATTTLAALLKLLMVLITTGWVCVWILLPTDLWRRFWKVAEERAQGTVFGYYGLNFAIFSLPIIAVAILGYLYLHIYTREQRNRWRGVSFPKLSAPLIIRSPLGILSLAELLTATLFILFLAWTFYSRISNDLDKMKPIKSMPLNKWQFKVMKTGTRLGLLSEACLVLLLLPVLRGMAVFQLLGIQFETSIRYHIWLGNMMMVFATLHGFLTLFVWGIKQKLTNEIFRWQKTGRVNIAGEITLAVGLLIWLTSLPLIRRKHFQLFYYTHHLYLIFLVFFLFHAGDRHFYTVLAGVLLYALDKLLRIVQSRQVTCLVSAQVLPCKAVELTLSKHPDLRYTPTSVIFLNIPSISRFQWHPFSITSCSEVNLDRIMVIAKCQGQWTNQLYNVIHAAVDSNVNHIKCLPVAVEGPYGPPSIYYQRYDSLLLVAGGIGITPFLSILQEIDSRNRNNRSKLTTSAQLIYVVKKSQDLSMLSSIFPLVLNGSHGQNHIRLQVYVTQEEKSSNPSLMELLQGFTQGPKVLFEANCFKHAVATPESLLSMAIITVFSLLVFAISIGFLSHAFLGSGRKESNKKNPSWVSDVLVISSFIITAIFAVTAGVILRWRKRKKEICMFSPKEPQGLELHLKEAQDSLQEQEIYFRRPNFQEIFSKFETQIGGSNVGVLVCGPESMQESVATVCRQYSYKANAKKRRCSFNFQSLNFAL